LAAPDPDPGTSTIWIPCPSETAAESVVSWHAAAVMLLPPLAEQESIVAEQLVPVPEQSQTVKVSLMPELREVKALNYVVGGGDGDRNSSD
jgi:hypothetical protein